MFVRYLILRSADFGFSVKCCTCNKILIQSAIGALKSKIPTDWITLLLFDLYAYYKLYYTPLIGKSAADWLNEINEAVRSVCVSELMQVVDPEHVTTLSESFAAAALQRNARN
jgi:hypothetical protein